MVTSIRAQQPCSCSCCARFLCNPTQLPTLYIQTCTLENCLGHCRGVYSQCRVNYPYGILSAQCGPPSTLQYLCRCDCCNTGSASCTPSYVGYAVAYLCKAESCSVACANRYPNLCVASHIGQTVGTCFIHSGATTLSSTASMCTPPATCIPPLKPTTALTTLPWTQDTCSCTCCASGSHCSPIYVGGVSACQCSSESCTQACHSRYPAQCPASPSIGQTIGTCINGLSGNILCKCSCCTASGCLFYDATVSEKCSMCEAACKQNAPCVNRDQISYTCLCNDAKLLFPWFIFVVLMNFSTFFMFK